MRKTLTALILFVTANLFALPMDSVTNYVQGIFTNNNTFTGSVTNTGVLVANNSSNQISGTLNATGGNVLTNSIWSFGAKGGTNDDTAAFQSASGVVTFSATNFTLSAATFTNPVYFIGTKTTLTFKSGVTNSAMITIPTNAANVVFDNFIFDGSNYNNWSNNSGSLVIIRTNLSRTAVSAYAYASGCSFNNCVIKGFDNAISLFGGNGVVSSTAMSVPKIQFLGLEIYSNGCAAVFPSPDANTVVEYVDFIGNRVFNCNTGAVVTGSNIRICKNEITACGVGVAVTGGGPNGTHSLVEGNIINHCFFPCVPLNISDTFQFLRNEVRGSVASSITLNNCKNTSFSYNFMESCGIINGTSANVNTNGPNVATGNTFSGSTYGFPQFQVYDYSISSNQQATNAQLTHWANYSLANPSANDGWLPVGRP